jgi:hypothetical protein
MECASTDGRRRQYRLGGQHGCARYPHKNKRQNDVLGIASSAAQRGEFPQYFTSLLAHALCYVGNYLGLTRSAARRAADKTTGQTT